MLGRKENDGKEREGCSMTGMKKKAMQKCEISYTISQQFLSFNLYLPC